MANKQYQKKPLSPSRQAALEHHLVRLGGLDGTSFLHLPIGTPCHTLFSRKGTARRLRNGRARERSTRPRPRTRAQPGQLVLGSRPVVVPASCNGSRRLEPGRLHGTSARYPIEK